LGWCRRCSEGVARADDDEWVTEVGKQIVVASAFEIGDAGDGLAPAREPGRTKRGRPSWLRLPTLGFTLSLTLHALPFGVLLLLGHAASEPPGAAPGKPGIEIAVAFGLPDAEPTTEPLPELMPIPTLAPPPEPDPPPPEPEPEVVEEPPPPEPDVVLIEETPPPEPVKVHEEPPKPKPEPPKPQPKPKVAQKPKPVTPAPDIQPQQVAATPLGMPDAPKDAGESVAPPSPDAAKGVSTPGAAAGPSAPAEGGPLVILDPAYRDPPSPPAYPPRSVMLGQQGQVVVRAAIDPRGNPEEVVVWTSSGFPLLDKAAIDAVKRWRFMPARRGSSTVAAWVQVPVNFKLR
jgi:periplasmic protein TonB